MDKKQLATQSLQAKSKSNECREINVLTWANVDKLSQL
jgi:hypothetical protein